MSKTFLNKYRTKSNRLIGWDYGESATYFITICTKERIPWFGKVDDRGMVFSKYGEIADHCWKGIPIHYPFVALDHYVIMPDHIHGLLIIDKAQKAEETQNLASLQVSKFGPQSKNLGAIVRGFKMGVTKKCRKINPEFKWQSNYYDRVIRNEREYKRVSEYIYYNPDDLNLKF